LAAALTMDRVEKERWGEEVRKTGREEIKRSKAGEREREKEK
jgi:hypothetical protein